MSPATLSFFQIPLDTKLSLRCYSLPLLACLPPNNPSPTPFPVFAYVGKPGGSSPQCMLCPTHQPIPTPFPDFAYVGKPGGSSPQCMLCPTHPPIPTPIPVFAHTGKPGGSSLQCTLCKQPSDGIYLTHLGFGLDPAPLLPCKRWMDLPRVSSWGE